MKCEVCMKHSGYKLKEAVVMDKKSLCDWVANWNKHSSLLSFNIKVRLTFMQKLCSSHLWGYRTKESDYFVIFASYLGEYLSKSEPWKSLGFSYNLDIISKRNNHLMIFGDIIGKGHFGSPCWIFLRVCIIIIWRFHPDGWCLRTKFVFLQGPLTRPEGFNKTVWKLFVVP